MKKILPLVLSLILFFTPIYAFASGGGGGNDDNENSYELEVEINTGPEFKIQIILKSNNVLFIIHQIFSLLISCIKGLVVLHLVNVRKLSFLVMSINFVNF